MVATINLANNSEKLLTQPWPCASCHAPARRVNHSYFSFSNVGSYVLCHVDPYGGPFILLKIADIFSTVIAWSQIGEFILFWKVENTEFECIILVNRQDML